MKNENKPRDKEKEYVREVPETNILYDHRRPVYTKEDAERMNKGAFLKIIKRKDFIAYMIAYLILLYYIYNLFATGAVRI